MSAIVWTAFGLMATGAVLGQLAFRQVVEIEFSEFHEQWIRDGKPVGGPKSRRAASFWFSGFATQNVFYTWLFQTPDWAKQSPEAMRLLTHGRLWICAMLVGVVTAGLVAIFAT